MEPTADQPNEAQRPLGSRGPVRRDQGATFVELLVSIVLIGTAVVATLTAVRTTIIASDVDTDHARAFEWLQAASDSVFNEPRRPCATTTEDPKDADSPADWTNNKGDGSIVGDDSVSRDGTVWTNYWVAVRDTPRPAGWDGATIRIVAIEFLGRSSPDAASFEWGTSYCYEGVQLVGGDVEDFRGSPFLSQRVSIEVTSPNGRITKTINTVKGG